MARNMYSDWYRFKRENEAYRAIVGKGPRSNRRRDGYAAEEPECPICVLQISLTGGTDKPPPPKPWPRCGGGRGMLARRTAAGAGLA